MSTSTSSTATVDIGEAFGYVFRSPRWFGRLALGALCLLFFWVLLIPVFILLGYFVETARQVSRGGRELPPWDDVGKMLREGFVLAVVIVVWSLPGAILSGGGVSGFHCDANGCSAPSSPLSSLGSLYSLLLGFVLAAIWSQYLDGGFTSAFDFRAVFRRTLMQPGMTVMVWLMTIVATIIGCLGLILVLVGALFTLPYAFAVEANLYGQFKAATEAVARSA